MATYRDTLLGLLQLSGSIRRIETRTAFLSVTSSGATPPTSLPRSLTTLTSAKPPAPSSGELHAPRAGALDDFAVTYGTPVLVENSATADTTRGSVRPLPARWQSAWVGGAARTSMILPPDLSDSGPVLRTIAHQPDQPIEAGGPIERLQVVVGAPTGPKGRSQGQVTSIPPASLAF